jgi:predicted amidohydrolase
VAKVTVAPAKWLRLQDKIGTLSPGAYGDITIFDAVPGRWVFSDRLRATVVGNEKLVPKLVIRRGEQIRPHGELLTDLKAA